MTLRSKLLLLVAAVTVFASVGVTAVAIVRDLGRVQELLAREGAAIAASLAPAAEPWVGSRDGEAPLQELALRALDVAPFQTVSIHDAEGRVLACADRGSHGCTPEAPGAFERVHGPVEALAVLFDPAPLHSSAPIVSRGRVIGAIRVAFGPEEVVGSARSVARSATWVSLFWIAGGVGLAAVLVQRATRPLTELVLAAEGIGKAEPIELATLGGDREVDELVLAFNRMSGRIQERSEEKARLIAELNQRVEDATREVLRADRLATLGGIAAGFAHELGNSLHVVRGYTSVALRELPLDHPNRRDVEAIRTESQRAAAMLERFLVFARARSARRELQPVGPILEEVLEMVRPSAAAAKVALSLELPPELPPALVDLELVRQAVMNLCINAIHACKGHGGGKVCVRARAEAEGALVVEVEDDGPGVPPELRVKIFEPFFTTKATGTGLGLAIVGHVASAHRGSVEVGSGEAGGARFRLTLPRGELS